MMEKVLRNIFVMTHFFFIYIYTKWNRTVA